MGSREQVMVLLERITGQLAEDPALDLPAGGARAGDLPEEHVHRRAALRRVRAGLIADELVGEAITEFIAADAATAAWLGASLADLSAVTGNTRQAARKRWPDLGRIYRVRRWLGGHAEDITTIVGMILDNASALRPDADDQLDAALLALRSAPAETVVAQDDRRSTHWQRWSGLIDHPLRTVVALAKPTTPEAERAVSGAIGLLAYYDSVQAAAA
jgi:hypothetical protein